MENSIGSHIVLSKSHMYSNAEMLLKSLEAKGQLNVKSILEALKHFIKKIEALSFQNAFLKNRLEQRSPNCKGRTESQTTILQKKVNELQKELVFYRSIENERNKLKIQINEMASIIRQLSCGKENSFNDRFMVKVTPSVEFERERLRELLNKMLGIEGKIIEFKEKADTAALLRKEVDSLRNELQDERCKEYKRIRKITSQYNKRIELIVSKLETCKKERDLYEKLTKKLEVEAKKAIDERVMYERKAQELECNNDKLLFELEKAKTQNTELLFRLPVRQDQSTKELKLALKTCRNQRDMAVNRNADYKKKLHHAMATINRLKILYSSRSQESLKKGSKRPIMGDVNSKVSIDENFIELPAEENIKLENYNFRDSSFRYWRKVSRNSNLLLKIYPGLKPPSGFKTEFLIKSDEDLASLQHILAPGEKEINEVLRKKKEQELFLVEYKAVVRNLLIEIRNSFLRIQG